MAAYHRVYDYACCHLQADCLELSSGPPTLDHDEYGYLYLFLHLKLSKVKAASLLQVIMTNTRSTFSEHVPGYRGVSVAAPHVDRVLEPGPALHRDPSHTA